MNFQCLGNRKMILANYCKFTKCGQSCLCLLLHKLVNFGGKRMAKFILDSDLDERLRIILKRIKALEEGGGGASSFLDLTDTPNSYSGQGNKLVAVNSGATGLTFGRRIFVSDSAPTSADGEDGDLWFEY